MRFDFPNKNGETLSGKLELPASAPRAFALFAHCFTCSKDFIAAGVIAKTLAEKGIGVLRFDFTGLGNSEGDFSNTNFTSNVDDLLSACEHLGREYGKPELLIGHSLGGAAVLRAATRLEQVKAVVTLNAPSDLAHLNHLFEDELDTIKNEGEAKVNVAGRSFTIKKQLIEDMAETEMLEGISTFRKALLVMHAPLDNIVSIDHAANIFKAAKHPKSFISLDSADHLLSRRNDARYAANVCAAWVDRFIAPVGDKDNMVEDGIVRVQTRPDAKFTQDIFSQDHHVVADEPLAAGGENLGMNPYEFLLAGLGACTSMTVKMYAERKGLPLEEVIVEMSHQKIHAEDCEQCETTSGKVDKIIKHIELKGDLSSEEQKRILEIAEKCPVNRTLKAEIIIESPAE